MAFNRVKDQEYSIKFIAGDTEYIRLNIKDEAGSVISVATDVTVTLGIKKNHIDDDFIFPEVAATTYVYDEVDQKYTIEFKLTSDDTVDLLNYEGKKRDVLRCVYDIELHNTHLGADERTTILAGGLTVRRSIAGKV